VYPALAVVAALDASAEVLWVGGEGGMEAGLVQRAGIPLVAIPAAGVHGVGLRALPGNIWRLVRGVSAARRVLRQFKPQVLFFTGGYVGVPIALAGWRLPKLVLVPDIEPGLALKLLSWLADLTALATEQTRRYLPPGRRCRVTGYPTRPELRLVDRSGARRALGLPPAEPVVLVFGGSRGAHSINQALWAHLPQWLELAHVVHITGELDWPGHSIAANQLDPAQRRRYHPYAYLHEQMADALAAADLAVARAGASTLGEFPLFGLPSILIPYPHAWRYQRVNAAYLEERGAALIIDDGRLETDLLPAAKSILGRPERCQQMAEAALRLAAPRAAREIAGELQAMAGKERGRRWLA
jgi:UDP-N-acetylglucosamine:LPS N-acetylglucosamine transferase